MILKSADPFPFPGYVEGTVTDTSTGAAISEARINTTGDGSALSLPNGNYLMVHPAGTFKVTARADGYKSRSYHNVETQEGETRTRSFRLVPVDMDSDGDGWSNLQEYRGRSDPNAPDSIPQPQKDMPWMMLLQEDDRAEKHVTWQGASLLHDP